MNLLDKNAYIGVKYSDTTNPTTFPNSLYQLKDKFTNTTTGEIFTCYANESYGVSWAGTQGTILDANILATNNANLVAMFTGDNISGSTLVDESGAAENCTIAGAVTTAGLFGNALSLDATDTLISTIGVTSDMIAGNTRSFSFWTKLNTIGTAHGFFGRFSQSALTGAYAYHTSGLVTVGIRQDSTNAYFGRAVSDPITAGVWYHLVIQYSVPDIVKIAINGSPKVVTGVVDAGTVNFINYPSVAPRIAGTNDSSATTPLYYDGLIDQYRIFNRVLTDNEIATLYAEGL